MRMSKHHYDAMTLIYDRKTVQSNEIKHAILACLLSHRMVIHDYSGVVYLTERGKASLRRVRGVGRPRRSDYFSTALDPMTVAAVRRMVAAGWFIAREVTPGNWSAVITPEGVRASERLKK